MFCWLLIVCGVALLSFGSWGMWWAVQSQAWPVADGRITTSQAGLVPAGSTVQGVRRFLPIKVSYEYEVTGRAYSASRVAFGDYGFQRLISAMMVVDRYPTGRLAPVHYMPSGPQTAVLETGLKRGNLEVPIIGLFLLTLGLVGLKFNRHPKNGATRK